VIDKSGVLYLGNTRIGGSNKDESQRVLTDKIKQWTKGQKQPWLVDVEADEKVAYGSIVPVIARLKELKVSMNLVIRPKARK
jgi:biopolymer transport protein ExbD